LSEIAWYFQHFGWWSVLDILLVALIFYWLLRVIRGTQAEQLLLGALVLIVVMVLAPTFLPFLAFGWLVDKGLPALLISIPVILQPELRRALERVGRTVGGTGAYLTPTTRELSTVSVAEDIVAACVQLAERKHGALIVLERTTGLEEHIETGIRLDSRVSSELLVTIFYPNTALHDGAVVVRRGRLVAAACVLPLASGTIADRQMGLRHRASIGVTEETDAIAVVVSEETGLISVARDGRIIRGLDSRRLLKYLQSHLAPPQSPKLPSLFRDVRERVGDAFGNEEQ
jgi:diadenylate cyclase